MTKSSIFWSIITQFQDFIISYALYYIDISEAKKYLWLLFIPGPDENSWYETRGLWHLINICLNFFIRASFPLSVFFRRFPFALDRLQTPSMHSNIELVFDGVNGLERISDFFFLPSLSRAQRAPSIECIACLGHKRLIWEHSKQTRKLFGTEDGSDPSFHNVIFTLNIRNYGNISIEHILFFVKWSLTRFP